MKKNIALLLTKYQIDVFLIIKEKYKLMNVSVIVPKGLLKSVISSTELEGYFVVDLKVGYVSFFRARAIVNEMKDAVSSLQLNKNDVFWLANDESPMAQCLNSLVCFNEVNFVEDGLGSYMLGSFLSYKRGGIAVLKKVKSLIYFFPYYKALYNMGGNIQGSKCYSFNSGVYPMQGNVKRIVIQRSYERILTPSLAPDNTVIFIGQPIVGRGYLSFYEYIKYINRVRYELEPGFNFLYKPHPLEKDLSMIRENGIKTIDEENISAEDFVYSSGKFLRVYGFYSTALVNIASLSNVDKVVSISFSNKKYYQEVDFALSRLGVQVLTKDN